MDGPCSWLVLPLALCAAGCEIFLPDDWGTLGSPCNEDSQCRDGLWCHEENCVGEGVLCGNGAIEAGEQCDGEPVSVSCTDLWLDPGAGNEVGCSPTCEYDTSGCGSLRYLCSVGGGMCSEGRVCVGHLERLDNEVGPHYRCALACDDHDDCQPAEICTLTLPDSEQGTEWACLPKAITSGYGWRCEDDGDCAIGTTCITMNDNPFRRACTEACTWDIEHSVGCEPGTTDTLICVEQDPQDFCGVLEWAQ